jgi:hypothetical protein
MSHCQPYNGVGLQLRNHAAYRKIMHFKSPSKPRKTRWSILPSVVYSLPYSFVREQTNSLAISMTEASRTGSSAATALVLCSCFLCWVVLSTPTTHTLCTAPPPHPSTFSGTLAGACTSVCTWPSPLSRPMACPCSCPSPAPSTRLTCSTCPCSPPSSPTRLT